MKKIIPLLTAFFCGAFVSPLAAQAPAQAQASAHAQVSADAQAKMQTGIQNQQGNEVFSAAIEAVLHDFPFNLRHITGDLLLAEGEIENYASTVELPGAEHCVITRYHSASDTTASWQAIMYSNEDFEKTARQYHALYNKLRSCYLLLADSSQVYLKGEWEPAREEMPFASSILHLAGGQAGYQEMQVRLEMIYQTTYWVVNINIFNTPSSLSPD